MAFQISFTARAFRDIDEIMTWLEQKTKRASSSWYERLFEKVRTLEDLPERFPLADESSDLGVELREMLIGKRRGTFRVLFIIDGNIVRIVHVRRASRGPITQDDM